MVAKAKLHPFSQINMQFIIDELKQYFSEAYEGFSFVQEKKQK